ncbi:MAG: transporter substrate-binding domain-containing protein [Alphaproteobacteria bacterium]|nr:transporter substrate-binding domain-containing protein [Alphaproteobacteria bacterium]
MRYAGMFALALGLAAVPAAAQTDAAAARRELAPTGKLRVAIAVSPAPSAFWATKDVASGQTKGVTVTLGTGLAAKLGVPVEFVVLPSSGEIVKSAEAAGGPANWDVTFAPVDEARKKILEFGAPYHLLQSTYLVAPGSRVATLADADAAGVRIAGIDNTATFRASQQASKNATHLTMPSVDEAVAQMRAGKVDAIALSRESLTGLAAKVPGARILEGGFLNSTTAVAVPKGRPAALAFATAFVEEAKASGAVRKAFDELGLTNSTVAPPGMKP